MAAGGISIHAVDIGEGRVAEGLRVILRRLAPEPATIAEGRIGANGLLSHPSMDGAGITTGTYEVEFAVAEFLAAQGRPAELLDIVPFRFVVRDALQHYHLPFKFTPHGFSLFRGA